MRVFKTISTSLLLVLFLVVQGGASEEVEAYLTKANPMIQGLQQNIQAFLSEVQPLREKKDIVGLKGVADKYTGVWDGMLGQLGEVEPPPEGEKHYQALKELFELQRESNQIMSETLGQRIALLMEIQKMRDAGATDDQLKEFAANNALDRDALLQKTSALKEATKEADETLKAEHSKLTDLVAGDEEEES
jgi:hypothetical protein